MNITITNRRFAVKPLLLCLTLLVTSVSGCAPLNTYSGRPFTPAAVTYNSIETPADKRAHSLRAAEAFELSSKGLGLLVNALESSSVERLVYGGKVLLSGCRALQECYKDYALSMVSGKIDLKKDSYLGDHLEETMIRDLVRAEQCGADKRAIGRIYYDHARIYLAAISTLRARGVKDTDMVGLYNVVIQNMRAARDRGIAEAAAYLRSH